MAKSGIERLPNVAAAYVRMSTEHQQYSTSNQMDVIREYAKRRGLEIVKIYSDEGKSGLNIQGRDSLAQMIRDVQNGVGNYSCILVYDISRWGRFQDADESAYYEYICRQAGVTVHYCGEQFENDGSPASTIIKSVKRTMAGEYRRELSSKVFQGACRLVQLGFRQGGTAGFGLRRVLVDVSGNRDYHNLALKSDGSLWMWGANDQGQCGDGTTNDLYRPSPVVGLGARTPLPLHLEKSAQPGFADLKWSSATGEYFALEYTTNLQIGFTGGPSNILATPPTNTLTVPAANRSYFYRLRF